MDVDVVLPCLDEAAALPRVLASLPDGVRAIVVDNGSTDGSADLARSLGATVVHEARRGYGAACHRGLLEATAAVVAFCDCDASLDLADLSLADLKSAVGDTGMHLEDDVHAALTLEGSVASRRHVGGTAPLRVRDEIAAHRMRLQDQ